MGKEGMIDLVLEHLPFRLRKLLVHAYRMLFPKPRLRVPFETEQKVTGAITRFSDFSARLFAEVQLLERIMNKPDMQHFNCSLEIGAGYGRMSPWIAKRSNNHVAIEPEKLLVKNAKQLYPHINFIRVITQNLPFKNDSFDLFVSWTVLMHVPPNQLENAMAEIKRVCRKEAILILAEQTDTRMKGKGSWKGTWGRSLETWIGLLKPWKLDYYIERKLECTAKRFAGHVMYFKELLE